MGKQTPADDLERIADYFRILADSSRLAILRCLILGGEMSVGEIAGTMGQTQANTSKHLKNMAGAGLLSRRKEGLHVRYSLADPVVEELYRLVSSAVRDRPARS